MVDLYSQFQLQDEHEREQDCLLWFEDAALDLLKISYFKTATISMLKFGQHLISDLASEMEVRMLDGEIYDNSRKMTRIPLTSWIHSDGACHADLYNNRLLGREIYESWGVLWDFGSHVEAKVIMVSIQARRDQPRSKWQK